MISRYLVRSLNVHLNILFWKYIFRYAVTKLKKKKRRRRKKKKDHYDQSLFNEVIKCQYKYIIW